MNTPPCIDCCQRHLGCHDICDNFQNYNQHRKQIAEDMAEDRKVEDYVNDTLKRIGRIGRKA